MSLKIFQNIKIGRMAMSSSTGTDIIPNKLQFEKSPYLLQHARNPVQWYPWGKEAFDAAKESNKLIFLSVGYSTCHWCHVMERESFENESIAKIMNENFINIKVDREERPDVDKVYMTFVTASSGSGGWPMNVFLTPNLVPVAGGTYFPPEEKYGRVSFPTILTSLANKWRTNPSEFKESGSKILSILEKSAELKAKNLSMPSEEAFKRALSQLTKSYEPDYGGFSESPKFPKPSNLNFLFAYQALYPSEPHAKMGVDMATHTLKMMAKGGIHDHVNKGFARYSTDREWHLPHFEKMLYDQAQLLFSYVDAYVVTKDDQYKDIIEDISTYVMRDLSHELGGFYSAEDADSLPAEASDKKLEGAFCVWTHEEICSLLGQNIRDGNEYKYSDVFCSHFMVDEGGNVDTYKDPHDELKNQNVLASHCSIEETANKFCITFDECSHVLRKGLEILYEERKKRPKPHLDDKILTVWNGMMLGALARAGSVLGNEAYVERAIKCANFIKSHMWKNEKLFRAAYRDADDSITLGSKIKAFSDDYAWMIRGLIHLYNATLDDQWLQWAEQLQEKQNKVFWDFEDGGYFNTPKDDKFILLKIKEDQDGAEPTVNSVASGNLITLSRLLNRKDYKEKSLAIMKLFSDHLEKYPIVLPEMMVSLMLHLNPAEQIILSGNKNSPNLKLMLQIVHSTCLNPNRIILIADIKKEGSFLYERHESLINYMPEGEQELAFICSNFSCSLPAKKPEQLKQQMLGKVNQKFKD